MEQQIHVSLPHTLLNQLKKKKKQTPQELANILAREMTKINLGVGKAREMTKINLGVEKVAQESGRAVGMSQSLQLLWGAPLTHPTYYWPVTLSLRWSPSLALTSFPSPCCSTASQASGLGLETPNCSQIGK